MLILIEYHPADQWDIVVGNIVPDQTESHVSALIRATQPILLRADGPS